MEFTSHQNPPDDLDRRLELARTLSGEIEIKRHIHRQGLYVEPPKNGGFTVINVLPDLIGMPLCDLVLAYMPSVNATRLRVRTPTDGEETCDGCNGRVTVYVDEKNIITRIKQEVSVAYGCGAEINQVHAAIRDQQPVVISPLPTVIGNMDAIKKADFS